MNLVELAQRLRQTRLDKGLTLDEVASVSGVGKGILSKVENFRVTPTLPTLAKLSEALGVKLSVLLEGLDARPRISVVRKDERKLLERDRTQSNIDYESLAHRRLDRAMDPFELRVPAHGGRVEAMPHEGEEFLTVLEGKVVFEFDQEAYHLETGDSLYFDAETNHRLYNETEKDARVLCVFLGRRY